ncbi:hypothetical protein ACQ4N7_29240 [Nodosilinea sp. AN01ver1]|uniref:hypothetical protein n=1 Tax=Nodosilinea sp. AN01ver1 TaxID=3423362 RepID=UPI003D3224E8
MQTKPSDAIALATLLKLTQGPQNGQNVTIHITDSFNTTDSHNRRYRYHQQEVERLEVRGLVRPSKIIPPLFAGFWLMSIMILLISGVSND